jgi:hypothetical protein
MGSPHHDPANPCRQGPDDRHNHGDPSECVTRLGTEGTLASRTTEGASQTAAASPLQEDQHDHEKAEDENDRLQDVSKVIHGDEPFQPVEKAVDSSPPLPQLLR